MLQIKRQYLQADSGADGGDVTATSDAQSDGGAADSGSVEFTAEQQAKIQELISKAFAKGAAKAGKDASKGIEDKIAELEEKLALAEQEKQIAATAATMSAKGILFSGDKSDVNSRLSICPKRERGSCCRAPLKEKYLYDCHCYIMRTESCRLIMCANIKYCLSIVCLANCDINNLRVLCST